MVVITITNRIIPVNNTNNTNNQKNEIENTRIKFVLSSLITMVYLISCNSIAISKHNEIYIHIFGDLILSSKILTLIVILISDYKIDNYSRNPFCFAGLVYLYTVILMLFYLLFESIYILNLIITNKYISYICILEFINNLIYTYITIVYYNYILIKTYINSINENHLLKFLNNSCIICKYISIIFCGIFKFIFMIYNFIKIKYNNCKENNTSDNIIKIINSDNIQQDCSICKQPINKNHKVCKLKCEHKFHKECLDNWIKIKKKSVSCPLCRAVIEV